MDNDTSNLLHTLSNPAAFDVFMFLHEGEKNVLEVRQHLLDSGRTITQPGVSHNLAMLLDVGVISVRRQGKYRYYTTKPSKYDPLLQALIEVVVHNSSPSSADSAEIANGQEIVCESRSRSGCGDNVANDFAGGGASSG